jgi:transposase
MAGFLMQWKRECFGGKKAMKWAQAVVSREQLVLIQESLDDVIAADHPIRGFDALLREMDWSLWEAGYDRDRGQPAIHPRLLAGVILWGLIKGMRTSRQLEEATRERLDLMWFLERRTLDHSTIAKFRVRFEKELKELTGQLSRWLVQRCEPLLLEMMMDGTRMRANSDRTGARPAQALERLVAECEKLLQEKLERLAQGDQEAVPEGLEVLEREVEQLQRQLEKFQRALAVARERDQVKQGNGGRAAPVVRVPVTDPDATVLPNKEGGFAPNYTPVVAVEGHSGAIVYADVVEGLEESAALPAALQAVESVLGKRPERVLADTSFASGANLRDLEKAQVEAYMPTGTAAQKCPPVARQDARVAIAPEQWEHLPRRGQQLDRSAFVYDAAQDRYYCPMGQPLTASGKGRYQRTGITYTRYCCPGRQGCSLATQCIRGSARRRMLQRDEYQDARDRVDERMATEAGQRIYRRRAPVVEGVFGVIKQAMGVRQFLLRGQRKVRIEWNWVCAAFNLKKLLGLRRTLPAGGTSRPGGASAWAAVFGCLFSALKFTLCSRALYPFTGYSGAEKPELQY